MSRELDNVDRGILHSLQLDARNATAQEIANTVGVSASTVRNRIDELETTGVIEGYHPQINYEAANLPFQVLFVCSAPPQERPRLVEKLLEIRGVIEVYETLTGHRNLYVNVVGLNASDVVRITDAIHELGMAIDSSEILRQRRVQPFNHFHFELPADEELD